MPLPRSGLFYWWNYEESAPVELALFRIEMDAAGLPLHQSQLVAGSQSANGKLLILIERDPNEL